MIKIKNKANVTYNKDELENFNPILKIKDKYIPLHLNSNHINDNKIIISKNNKKYHLLKDKWVKCLDIYQDILPNEYYRINQYFKHTLNLGEEFEYIPDGYKYLDLEGVGPCRDLFCGSYKLKKFDAKLRNYEQITYAMGWFYHCSSLERVEELDLSYFNNVDMMFDSCMNLIYVPTLDLSNITCISSMFLGCSKLEKINFINFGKNNLFSGAQTFYNCNNLKSINGLNLANMQDMNNLFYNCNNLIEIPTELDFTNCISCNNMFYGVNKISNITLKNVSSNLDLSNIGTSYTVLNYI